ncbi:MAG: hypothetical protein NVS2B8_07590 [Vulcanimicrobiaceae bacterium]
MADDAAIRARRKREHRAARRPDTLGDRVHFEAVGEADAGKTELLPQARRQDERRERGGPVGVERGHDRMHRHHRARPRGESPNERHEIASAQIRGRRFDRRQRDVAIDGGRAVAGKMLRYRNDSLALEAARDRSTQRRDALRIVAERPRADDGARRYEREIEDGREIDVGADRGAIAREPRADSLREIGIARRAERHHRGYPGLGKRQARDAAAFLIDAYQRRDARPDCVSHRAHELPRRVERRHVAVEENDGARLQRRELARGLLGENAIGNADAQDVAG